MDLLRSFLYLIVIAAPMTGYTQSLDSLFIETYPDGVIYRKYNAILTTVVDTLITEDIDTGEWTWHIQSYESWCPDGMFEEYAPDGQLMISGTLRYTYGTSSRSGTWEFYDKDGSKRSMYYDPRRQFYFPEDPSCRGIDDE